MSKQLNSLKKGANLFKVRKADLRAGNRLETEFGLYLLSMAIFKRNFEFLRCSSRQ